ncbi:MAG TPA: TIR domain-containing protein [Bradyrhizobium sp.]
MTIDGDVLQFRYDAFISYRHGEADGAIAERLHKLLENFRTPSHLVKAGALPRLKRVFRDREELPTSSDLSESILEALQTSRFMIVICSPRSMQSKWVSEEIKIFRALGRQKQILTLLIDGEPSEAFPTALIERRIVKVRDEDGTEREIEQLSEPLAADIRAPGLNEQLKLLKPEVLRLLAPILDCKFDDLRQRAQARARQRLIAAVAALSFVTAVFAGLAGFSALMYFNAEAQRKEASEQRTLAVGNAELANINEKKAEENAAVSENRRRDNQVAEANRVAALSRELTSSDHADLALAVTLDIAPDGDDRPMPPQLSAAVARGLLELRMPVERNLGEKVISTALSPNGLWLATGDEKGMVRLLDPITLSERFHFQPGQDGITSLKFSPDSRRILAAGSNMPVVWDLEKRQKLFVLDREDFGRTYATPEALFSPDGSLIVVATLENRALIYDAMTGALLRELHGPTFEQVIAGYPDDAQTSRWISDPNLRNTFQGSFDLRGLASDVAFSPDGSLIAITGWINPQSTVWIFDARSGAVLRMLRGRPEVISLDDGPRYHSTLTFSSDGSVLVAAPTGNVINVWSVKTGALKSSIAGDRVSSLVLTKDGRGVISGEGNGSLVAHCIDGASSIVSLQSHTGAVQRLALNPAGTLLASASRDRTARVWTMPKGSDICVDRSNSRSREALAKRRPIAVISGHNGDVTDAAFSTDGNALITSSVDRYIRRWTIRPPDSRSYEPVTKEAKGKFPTAISDIGLNSELLVGGDNKTVFTTAGGDWFAWDLASNNQMALGYKVRRIAVGNGIEPPALFAAPLVSQPFDSETFDARGFSLMADGAEHRPEGKINFGYSVEEPVAPSGARVVMASKASDSSQDEGTIPRILVDTATGRTIADLAFKHYKPQAFFFSPDGERLFGTYATPNSNRIIVLLAWNASTGDLIATSDEITVDDAKKAISSRVGDRLLFPGKPGGQPSILLDVTDTGFRRLKFPLPASPRSITMAPSGAFIAAGYNDGPITVAINPSKILKVLDTRGLSVDAVVLSPDDGFLAAVDASNTLWVFELSTGITLRSYTMQSRPSALRFFPDSSRIAIADSVGTIEVVSVHPDLPGVQDPQALVDWARASRLLSLSVVERQRYGITGRTRVKHPALDAIQAAPLAPMQLISSPGTEASACDKLADNPYDRGRRTEGVLFDRFDAASAQKTCDEALAKYPDDLVTRYHVTRIHDRLGELDVAMEGYRALSQSGYAAAMRGVARLIDLDQAGHFKDLGPSAAWLDRSAEAGDPTAHILIAARIASEDHYQDNMNQILSLLETAGTKNRSEALMAVATWLGLENPDPDKQRRTLFFELAGLELNETMDDDAPIQNRSLQPRIRQSVRNLAATMPPRDFVDVYREARGWVSSSR